MIDLLIQCFLLVFLIENIFYILWNENDLIKLRANIRKDKVRLYPMKVTKKERKKYFNKKSGAEWLAFDWKYFYISTQNKEKKNNLLKFSLQQQKNINPNHSYNLKLEKTYNINYKDLSWMTFHKKELYIISDKNDLYLIYDFKKEKIKFSEKLEKGNWEWIVFDNKLEMFLADDTGRVVKLNNN